MASPEYGPMVKGLEAIFAGDPQFLHYDFPSAAKLAFALSAPVTELATFYLLSESHSWDENVKEFLNRTVDGADGLVGGTSGWSLEDVEHDKFPTGEKGKAYLLAIGWESLEAHMAFRETDLFKNSISLLMGEPKSVELHHVAIQSKV